MKTIKKCKKCGSKDFYIDESLGWKCYINKDGGLDCYNKADEINEICCDKCGEIYSEEEFKQINFN